MKAASIKFKPVDEYLSALPARNLGRPLNRQHHKLKN
jgi:hypothetical protein